MQRLKDLIKPEFGIIPRSSLSIVKTDTDILCGAYGLPANSGAALNFLKLYFPSIANNIDTLESEAHAKFLWVRCYNSVPVSLFRQFEDSYFEEVYFGELKNIINPVIDLDKVCDGLKLCFYSWLMESTPDEIKTIVLKIINMYGVKNIDIIGTRQLVNAIYDHRYERYPILRYQYTERNAILEMITTTTIYDKDFIAIYEANKYAIDWIYGSATFKDNLVRVGKLYPSVLSPSIEVPESCNMNIIGRYGKYYMLDCGYFVHEDDLIDVLFHDPEIKRVHGYVILSKQHAELIYPSDNSKIISILPRSTKVVIDAMCNNGTHYRILSNNTWISSNEISYTYTHDYLYTIKTKSELNVLIDHEDGSEVCATLEANKVYEISEARNNYLKVEPELGWLKINTAYEKVKA